MIVVMFWNTAGWTLLDWSIFHSSDHNSGHFCEVVWCSCQIEKGEKICTCHHEDVHQNGHQEKNHEMGHHVSSGKQISGDHYSVKYHSKYGRTGVECEITHEHSIPPQLVTVITFLQIKGLIQTEKPPILQENGHGEFWFSQNDWAFNHVFNLLRPPKV